MGVFFWIGFGLVLAAVVAWLLVRNEPGRHEAAGATTLRSANPPAPSGTPARALESEIRATATGQAATIQDVAPPTPEPGRPNTVSPVATKKSAVMEAPPGFFDEEPDEETDLTIVTIGPLAQAGADPDRDDTTLRVDEGAAAIEIDDDAGLDEPSQRHELKVTSAVAANANVGTPRAGASEDGSLALEDELVFAIADAAPSAESAAHVAIDLLAEAFRKRTFVGKPHPNVPLRGAELVLAIQMANHAVYEHAREQPEEVGAGVSVIGARFSPRAGKLYVAHVGDGRAYRCRSGVVTELTGRHARALGASPGVKVDLVALRPRIDDVYLLASHAAVATMSADALARALKDGEKNPQRAAATVAGNARGKHATAIVLKVGA